MQRNPATQRLSPREREVALLLAEGLKPELVARRLMMSLTAVKLHAQRAQWRLGLPSRAALIQWVRDRRDPACQDGRLRRLRVG
jgi:DNA-binding NarL/FixJ family response regulator